MLNFFLFPFMLKRVPDYIGVWLVIDGELYRVLYPRGHRYAWIWERENTTALDRIMKR